MPVSCAACLGMVKIILIVSI